MAYLMPALMAYLMPIRSEVPFTHQSWGSTASRHPTDWCSPIHPSVLNSRCHPPHALLVETGLLLLGQAGEACFLQRMGNLTPMPSWSRQPVPPPGCPTGPDRTNQTH